MINILKLFFIFSFFITNSNAQSPKVTFDFIDTDIRIVINEISNYIDKDIIIDPRVEGRVTAKVSSQYTQSRALLENILETHNFLLIDSSDHFRVIPKSHAENIPLSDTTYITKNFPLKSLTPEEAKNLVLPHIKRVVIHDSNNSITATFDRSISKKINELINNSDLSKPLPEYTTFHFNNVNASELINSFDSYFEDNYFLNSLQNSVHFKKSSQPKNVIEYLTLLDKRSPQVLIDAYIYELIHTNTNELGFDINRTNSSTSFDNSGTLFGLDLATNILNFELFVEALNTNNKVNVLSNPRVVTLTTKEASLLVGQEVPFITTSRLEDESSEDDSTSEGETLSNVRTIVREDVGLQLTVTPTVVGEYIELEINQEVSSISDSLVASDVITNVRSLDTTISLKDGQAFLLGGLKQSDNQSSVESVPFFSTLPILGFLFKRTSKDKTDRTLLMAIRARLLKERV